MSKNKINVVEDIKASKPKAKIDFAHIWFKTRQFAALTLLSAGSVAYIAEHLEQVVMGWTTYVAATVIVALILHFGLKR